VILSRGWRAGIAIDGPRSVLTEVPEPQVDALSSLQHNAQAHLEATLWSRGTVLKIDND
jgi:hypothetical protein